MILEEYDEELHIMNEKKISERQGIQQGMQNLSSVLIRLKDGEPKDDIIASGVERETVEAAAELFEKLNK